MEYGPGFLVHLGDLAACHAIRNFSLNLENTWVSRGCKTVIIFAGI